ncbi:S-adenosyl-L-methionine-dependent methyltransferase [Leucosporidium creatinivorum]|uniref:S-adenosyl-L-methionine-dependent methyltransferase n=1 Tax=Leucosporidium creatinivorum TaxID=106004 RepID=A0A1Y2FZU6_9BASI|nr:S-adenosyl-L-methionine-dependent methyltransferase [Leucosporidium creatinivorum]
MDYSAEALGYALQLIEAAAEDDFEKVKVLVGEIKADAWVQDAQGWTALHAAASVGNVAMCKYLLRSGNAVWQIVDNLGCTAGDIAFSLNEAAVYDFLLGEGVRAEMLRAAMEAAAASEEEEEEEEIDEDGDVKPKLSTASDNATFLASKLKFTKDSSGQEIAVDEEGNGVMMGWEREIMRVSAERLCEPFTARRKGVKDSEEELNVVNVGFGLGIIDSYLQEFSPTQHLIIEPHPDVLAHARSIGFFDKPGVRFYEGTWRQYLKDLEDEKEEYVGFDAIYFDTYSEHYSDLHAFFDVLPNLLRSPESRFSFFHGLGATSRLLYDVYTSVSELHLKDIGLTTEWGDVDIGNAVGTWEGVDRKYWGEVGPYRLPLCKLEF